MDAKRKSALADVHFQLVAAGQMSCDYVGINLLGDEEPTISPRVIACFYVAKENEHGIDMVVVAYGGAGKEFIETELGITSRMKIDSRRIQEQSGEHLVSLTELLTIKSGGLARVRQFLRERELPFAVVLVGRRLPELECDAFLWQLPFLESTSVLEKIQERLKTYIN